MATKTQKKKPAPQAPTKRVRKRNIPVKGNHSNWRLVLVEDVTYLGKQGDVVEVRPGYARNYLLPRGLAVVPNKESLRQLDRYKIRVQEAREARMADLRTLSEQIAKLKDLTIQVRATEEGHLYGSVGAGEIAAALRGRNIHIDPTMVRMQGGIKEIGVYKVDLHLGYDIDTSVTVAIAAAQEK